VARRPNRSARPITAAVVRRLALALPEATESSHFDHPDFRVRNKIFATLPKDGGMVCLKTTPANLDALVSFDATTFRDVWRARWIGVRLDGVTVPMLRELLEDAWRLAAPKRLWTALSASGERRGLTGDRR
jgi:hypothetical protein